MSFVLAQSHRSTSLPDLPEISLSHRLKGFFNMPAKRSESRKSIKSARPLTLRRFTNNNSENVYHSSDSRKSSFCEEIPVSPARFVIRSDVRDLRNSSVERVLFPTRPQGISRVFNCLEECASELPHDHAQQKALAIPEIVEAIVLQLEQTMNLAATTTKNDKPASIKSCEDTGPLFACLTVNRAFHEAAKRVISKRVALHDLTQVAAYTAHAASQDNLCRDLLIHRVKTCEQDQFEQIQQFRLRSLELYVCPKLIPTPAMLSSGTLLKIALPGCALVDDNLMMLIARTCKKLQILDLRACEMVSDDGIIAIAESCPKLSYLNVGRIKRSEAITDRSIIQICRRTSVETLGLAGCAITDESVLAVARHRGSDVERLSMNQCFKVTDYAICELLRSSPRLQVLEVVGCDRLQDAKTMCFFKLSTGALVETTERFAAEMQLYEQEVKYELERLKLRAASARSASRRVTA